MKTRTIALVATGLASALVLAGCSTTSSTTMPSDMPGMDHSSSSAAPQFNDPDLAFVTQMIPHHQQAVQMTDIVLSKKRRRLPCR